MVSTDLFIPPEPVKVLGGRHPLTNEHRQVEVRAGATIAEALDISIASTGLDWPQDRFVATVNDVRVPREWWHRVRPKPGTMVVFRPVASGDDSLRTILFLGIAVAALFIAPFIAGPAVLGLTGAALQAGTALIGGAITLGGALLLNALMPLRPPQQDTGQAKTLPMIQGASNEVRPWGSVPVILGRHRISPPYAAMPYSHFTGQKQYMSLLFAIGYGPLHIEPKSLKIGETSIDPADSKFEEITTEIDEAFDMEKYVKLFKRNVNEIPLSLPLKSSLAWEGRTTGDATSVISLDVIAPAGIWIFDKKTGKYKDRPVTINVQYRKNVPGQPVHVGAGWIARPNIVFHLTRDTYRMGAQWNVTPAGLWDVRLRKATPDYPVDGKEQVADAIIWQTLRGFQTGVPITFPQKLALIGMNARASDQFNGVINTFNCVVQSYVWGYNGTSWVANQLSSNPADLFHHVLTGPANARPRKPGLGGYGDSSGDIDYDSIQRWWQDCHTYGYTYNAVISDQRTVREVLSDIAAAGRATVALRNGKWGVSFPRASDPVSWHFTPRNSSALKSTRTYREMPHALRVRYIDGSAKGGWKQTEGIVYNDTLDGSGPNGQYTAATAHLFETVEFPGITDWGNIHKAARFQLAQALLRPETHTLNADIESLRLERGDKVILSTETLLIGTGYGRVVSVDAATQTVIVDSRVIMVPGKTYQVKFTIIVAGAPQILQRTVLNSSSETDTLQLSLSDPIPLTLPVRDNLFSFGETALVTRDYRVLDVRPAADLTAQFTLVDDAPGIEFLGNIPDYDPGVDGLPDPFTMVPQSVTFNESFSGSGITAKSTVQLTVQIPRVGTIRAFEFQSKDVDNSGDWTPFAVVNAPLLTATKDNMEPGAYQFRVRALFREDYAIGPNDFSAWVDQVTGMDGTKVDIVHVHNLFDLPPDVENFRVTVSGDTMRFEWDAVASPILAFYRIKYNTLTDRSALWGSSVELATPSDTSVSIVTRSGTFLIKAVTYTQAESENENDIIVVTTAGKPANIVSTLFEAPYQTDASPPVLLGPPFPGYFFSTKVQSGLLLTLGIGTPVKDIVTNQGLAALSSNTRTISQILVDLSITGVKLLLETGTAASWPGSGQKWLDESGNGYDFFLGLDGTVSATDPTFVGTVGDKTRNAYWNFDGGDYFTYDTVNEAWMNSIHQDNAKFSIVVSVYVPALDTGVNHSLVGDTTTIAEVGFQFFIVNNNLVFHVTNGTTFFGPTSSLAITTTGWHTVGISFDEAAGVGTFMLDGVTQSFSLTYTSPSAAAATYKLGIGTLGSGTASILTAGWRMSAVAMWQSVLADTQLALLGNTIQRNDDIFGLKLLLESGTIASWPGSGQKWLDEAGSGYDFFLGSSGTASPTDPAEPSFVGTVGDLTRNAYWNFDGGDYFTYDTTNEVWMDHIHKFGAKLTVMMSVYVPTLGSNYHLLGNSASAKPGLDFFVNAAGGLQFDVYGDQVPATGPTSVQQIITGLNLTTNLMLLLESGTVASNPNSGQKWLDESGGGYDFFVGLDATVSATDPTFVGTVNALVRDNAYWNLDGGDYFTYDTTSEAWMDRIHKDNAKASGVFSFYVPTLGGIYSLWGNAGTISNTTLTGSVFQITAGNVPKLFIFNGVGSLGFATASTLTITAIGWHTAGFSVDEAAGTVTYMLDGVTQIITGMAYVSPSAGAASFKAQIGAVGNAANISPNGTRIHSVSVWEGVALTAAQLASVGSAINNLTAFVPFKSLTTTSALAITTIGWHVIGISFDETAGLGTFMIDGVVEGFTGNYTSPSILPASYPVQIGAAGNAVTPLPTGTHLRAVGVWEGLVLGDDQMVALAAVAVASANYYLYTGSYQFLQYIDLGSVYTSRITANVVASGLKAGDTMDHWARLSDVTALNTVDPSAWSVEMVYLASNGPTAKKSVLQMLTDQNLLTGVKLVLESAALASWPNTGQNWLDESGGHYDFILGATIATSPTETSDPGFVGSPDTLLRTISYWNFDGGDYFTYKTTNETWMDAIHKDNAKFTAVVSVYVPALDTGIQHYLMGNTAAVSQVGFQFYIQDNKLNFITTNGVASSFGITSTLVIAAAGWHTVGISIDEATGAGIFMLDGVTQTFVSVYTSPSAAASSLKFNLGAVGAGTAPLQNGWRMHAVAMWQTVALTAAQLTALGNSFQHNEDWVFGDWTPFGITDVTARIIIFGIHLTGSPDGSVSPAVSKLSVTIDMPDRHEGFHIGPPEVPGGSGSGAGGYYVKFDPPFKKLTDVALSNFDLNTTERYTLTQRDEHGVVVTFYASTGAVVSKTFDLHAYGYGEVVSS